MKLVTAIIKPHMVEDVKEAVTEAGVTGMTIAEVRGFGRQRGHTEVYRGAEYQVDFVPKVKMEILCDSGQADGVVDAIVKSAGSGQVGDGKIWVTSVERTVRIRTGEEDVDAL